MYFILLGMLPIQTIHGQAHQVDNRAQTEIKKLHFLTGQWEGSGWILGED